MKTYLVYDRKSGKIVHAHGAPGEARRKPDEILRLVHPTLNRSQLETVEVESEEMRAGGLYRVNPKTKKLEPAKSGAISSGGVSQYRGGSGVSGH